MPEPIGLRGNWFYHGPYERDGFVIQTSNNGLDKSVGLSIYRQGELVHFDRIDEFRWRGHCSGKLIIDPLLERLKARFAEAPAAEEGCEAGPSLPSP